MSALRPGFLLAMLGLLALAVVGALWLSGLDRVVMAWALEGQREAQGAMARALRALRAGEPAALATLIGLCFTYGVFHAAGPGHGKLLIGGYGAARPVGAWRLSGVALAASLAQAGTAIALVGLGLLVFRAGRERLTDSADHLFAALSAAGIALIGLWLALRGGRALWRRVASARAHDHGHVHGPDCGHAHLPDAEAVAQATGWRDIAALIAAIAIRPCTGALFVLILTAQMGLFLYGVLATIAMALGVASVTVAVALGAVGARRGLLSGLSNGAEGVARLQPWVEIAVGLALAYVSGRVALALI